MRNLFLYLLLTAQLPAFCQQAANTIPYGNNKEAGKYYDIRGFKMYCEVYGQGQPLLIIHGNGGSINNL